jgi:hypothetical protein
LMSSHCSKLSPITASAAAREELALHAFEVEVSDDTGQTYALLALRSGQLIVLHYEPALAA